MEVKATFGLLGWDEKTWEGQPTTEVEGPKCTRATVTYSYEGAITGESQVEYVMAYCGDGSYGNFVAIERVHGGIEGRSGSFVLQHVGTFDKDGVRANLTVVPDSGIGELTGLSGTGHMDIPGHMDRYPITLDYQLP